MKHLHEITFIYKHCFSEQKAVFITKLLFFFKWMIDSLLIASKSPLWIFKQMFVQRENI